MFTWGRITLRKDPVEKLLLVEVALKATKALKEAIEEHGKVLVVLEHVVLDLKPHGCCEAFLKFSQRKLLGTDLNA